MSSASPLALATILLAEDEVEVRQFLATLLRDAAYEVLEAENGAHALLAAHNHPGSIELLITDVLMPVMTGPEMARQFGLTRPGTPVLFISGYSDPAAAAAIQACPGAQYLRKPFTAQQLLDKVRTLLG